MHLICFLKGVIRERERERERKRKTERERERKREREREEGKKERKRQLLLQKVVFLLLAPGSPPEEFVLFPKLGNKPIRLN